MIPRRKPSRTEHPLDGFELAGLPQFVDDLYSSDAAKQQRTKWNHYYKLNYNKTSLNRSSKGQGNDLKLSGISG